MDDTGWTYEAIGAAMSKDRAYIHRVLNGDKSMSLEFQKALPDDIEARYHQLCAEAAGLIVVALPATREEAQRDLVSGIVGLFHHQLPTRADRMARVELNGRTAAAKTA